MRPEDQPDSAKPNSSSSDSLPPVETSLETAPSMDSAPDSDIPSLEKQNILHSPNIAAPESGPTPEELAEEKRQAELAKLDELKPLVEETLIDDGKDLEKKRRRPLIVTLAVVFVISIIVISGVMLFVNMHSKTHEHIPAPVITYDDKINVLVQKDFLDAFSKISQTLTNFTNLQLIADPEESSYYEQLRLKNIDFVAMELGQDENMEDPDAKTNEFRQWPIVNDALFFVVSKDTPVKSLNQTQLYQLYFANNSATWHDFAPDDCPATTAVCNAVPTVFAPSDSAERFQLAHLASNYTPTTSYEITSKLTLEESSYTKDVLQSVVDHSGAIGIIRASTLDDKSLLDQVNLIAVSRVSPTDKNIQNASYPFTIQYGFVSLSDLPEDSAAMAYIDSFRTHLDLLSQFYIPVSTEPSPESDVSSDDES